MPTHISHMCHIFRGLYSGVCAYMYHICVTGINYVTRRTVHVNHIILWKNITQHIWLPHWKYKIHYPDSILANRPGIDVYVCQNTTNCNPHHVIAIYILEIKCLQNAHICHIWYTIQGHIWGMYVHTFATYESTGLKHVTSSSVHVANYISCYCHASLNKYG